MRCGGSDTEKMLPGRRSGDSEQKVVVGCRGSLLLQKMMLGGSRGSFQQVMMSSRRGLLLQKVLLRSSMRTKLQGRRVIGRLGRLGRFRRGGRFGRSDTHYSGQAQQECCEREEDGEGAEPLHGTTYG